MVVEIGRVLMRRTVEKSGLVSAPPGPVVVVVVVRSSVKVLDLVRSGGLCEEEDKGFVFWFGGSESSSSSLDLDIVKKRR